MMTIGLHAEFLSELNIRQAKHVSIITANASNPSVSSLSAGMALVMSTDIVLRFVKKDFGRLLCFTSVYTWEYVFYQIQI